MLHFVEFADPRYEYDEHFERARRLFGEPDFVHRHWDWRAREEIVPGDWAVFARGTENDPIKPFTFNDSERL